MFGQFLLGQQEIIGKEIQTLKRLAKYATSNVLYDDKLHQLHPSFSLAF